MRWTIASACYRFVMILRESHRDLKSARTLQWWNRNGGHTLDVTLELTLRDRFQKALDLSRLTAALQLDAPIGKIAYPADDLVTARNMFASEAKAHALHAAFVENLAGGHGAKCFMAHPLAHAPRAAKCGFRA